MSKAVVYKIDDCFPCNWIVNNYIQGKASFSCQEVMIDSHLKIIPEPLIIPDWCPLDDWGEDIAKIDQEAP